MQFFKTYKFFFLLSIVLASKGCSESKIPILSGPMVGAVAMRSVKIWVQMDYRDTHLSDPSNNHNLDKKSHLTLKITKIDPETSNSFFDFDDNSQIIKATMNKDTGIALFELKDLEPGMEYQYSLDGYEFEWYRPKGDNNAEGRFKTKPFWKYRSPKPPNFKFVFAPCHYVNEESYDRLGKPWGANYEIFQHIKKENPDFNYPLKGIYRNFTWGDAEFFLLDNRTFRTANRNRTYGKRTILGEKQLEWLFNALADSSAKFKFIVMGGQFLNSAKVYENYSNYAEEKIIILNELKKNESEKCCISYRR